MLCNGLKKEISISTPFSFPFAFAFKSSLVVVVVVAGRRLSDVFPLGNCDQFAARSFLPPAPLFPPRLACVAEILLSRWRWLSRPARPTGKTTTTTTTSPAYLAKIGPASKKGASSSWPRRLLFTKKGTSLSGSTRGSWSSRPTGGKWRKVALTSLSGSRRKTFLNSSFPSRPRWV